VKNTFLKGAKMDTEHRSEKEQVRVRIDWMKRRHMPEVLQTEQASFDFSWTEEDIFRCLRQRNCIGMVAELGEKVAGFMIYELHRAKIHILNFAVHPTCRRLGIGAQMVAKLISKLSIHRHRTKITLEIRETNLPAQLFFLSQGFLALRVLPGFYEDSGEDAFWVQHQLPISRLWSDDVCQELFLDKIRQYPSPYEQIEFANAHQFGCSRSILEQFQNEFDGVVFAPECLGARAYPVLPLAMCDSAARKLRSTRLIAGLFPEIALENHSVEMHPLPAEFGLRTNYLATAVHTPLPELIGREKF
jgi:ribosomal-protein-alanine N-acetyltransferase